MDHPNKGSNIRLIGRLLDQLDLPLVILDRRGQIAFVNAAMAQKSAISPDELVGKSCSWRVAEDSSEANLLTILAPPADALDGRSVLRELPTETAQMLEHIGQLFLPVPDSMGTVQLTLVLFGPIDLLKAILAQGAVASESKFSQAQPEKILLQLRSRWPALDGLSAMFGSSPAMELAMQRCQLAISSPCNVLIYGPAGVGKHEVAQSLFATRLKRAEIKLTMGQCFPIDCRKLNPELIENLLEIFTGRLNSEAPAISQQLILNGLDHLSDTSLVRLIEWFDQHRRRAVVVATSNQSSTNLATRGEKWRKIVSRIATIEIHLSGLSDRRQDIAPLALQAISEACQQMDRAQLTLASDALNLLEAYAWPGNTRQLRQALRESVSAAILSSAILPSHLPVAIRTYPGATEARQVAKMDPIDLDAVLIEVEKVMIARALKLSPRNRAGAARLLGISRPRLLRRIEQLQLSAPLDLGQGTIHDS